MCRTLLLIMLLLSSKLGCDLQKLSKPASTALARVHNKYLYKEDIVDTIPADVEQCIQTWAVKGVLRHQAEKEVTGALREKIEKTVDDFRATLLIHVYLEKLVNEKVQTDITDQEIQAYYHEHPENFQLKDSIFKGKLVIVPRNAPQISRLKQLILQDTPESLQELKEYCATHATYSSLDNKVWHKLDDILPPKISSKILYRALDEKSLAKKNYLKEIQDASFCYYLEIQAYRSVNDIEPMERVKDKIAQVILHKQKIQLTNQIRADILAQAKINRDYTIYEKKN